MKINGPKTLVRQAVFAACLLNVFEFDLEIAFGDEDECGSGCIRNEDGSFKIDIQHDAEGDALIELIGHEMTHLAQYIRGHLVDLEDEKIEWKGDVFDEPEHCSDEYFLAPWELEARAMEDWIKHRWYTRNELH